MILSKYTYVKIAPSNINYWRDFGYEVKNTGGRAGKNTGQRIKVQVQHLLGGSNVNVSCVCDSCSTKYIQRFSRNKDVCYPSRKQKQMLGNTLGTANKGRPGLSGVAHPRWNENKPEFQKYANRVRWLTKLTYDKNKHTINPNNLPRTLCGIDGGYQLDHIISIKEGFERDIPIEEISSINNLQLLPWEENRAKGSVNAVKSLHK